MVVICDRLHRDHAVPFPIRKCTQYLDKNQRDLEEMEDFAWILYTPFAKRKAGFAPPENGEAAGREIELKHGESE